MANHLKLIINNGVKVSEFPKKVPKETDIATDLSGKFFASPEDIGIHPYNSEVNTSIADEPELSN
ncbi:MAG TPA: hypothetical protein DCP90_05315 [Clostridiales bacterium]|nr:MAG: hypothetical protein A2Y22_08890 [Clostridiales bacterium GWD2_32_59]HAN10019.1 hypothetical protein [Clostridiales bacterium]